MVTRSPSPSTARAQSPNPRTPDPTSTQKKAPWVGPLGSPRHQVHGNLHERQSGTKVRTLPTTYKENHCRGRSSPVPCLKISKNFMAPTASASFKRRVLSERNDGVRSSLASSVTDSLGSIDSLDVDGKSNVGYASEDDLDLTHVGKWESDAAPSPISASAVGVSLPPYDPEINYLSPRPRFLHYRPKPHAEPNEGKHLEDSFSSESCDEDSPQRSGDAQSSSTPKNLDNEEGEECENISADSKDGETPMEHIFACSSEKPKPKQMPKPKSGSFISSKFMALVLLLMVGCLCINVPDSPIVRSLPDWESAGRYALALGELKDPSLRGYFSKAAKYGNSNFKEFVRQLLQWLADTSPHFLGSKSVLPRDLGGFAHANLTSPVDKDTDLVTGFADMRSPAFEMDEIGEASSQIDDEPISNEFMGAVIRTEEDSCADGISQQDQDIVDENLGTIVDANSLEKDLPAEEEQPHPSISKPEAEDLVGSNLDSTVPMRISDVEPPYVDMKIEEEHGTSTMEEDGVSDPPEEGSESECIEGQEVNENNNLELLLADGVERKHKYPFGIILAMSSLAIAIIVIISLYIKSNRHPLSSSVPEKPRNARVPDSSCSNMLFQEQCKDINDSPIEVETFHESGGPSASSSIRHTALRGRKTPRTVVDEEVFSHDSKTRRDSTASSTSFGSFTVYEKLSGKKGGQDEAMTPVRRSSRIRKQVTSP